MMLPLKEIIAPKGTVCRPGYLLEPKYITIHNTANTNKGAGAENHGRYLQGTGKGNAVSYHYVVDSGVIVRIIPDNETAWHAGDGLNGTGNRTSIAIEICENPESNLLTATDAAAELTANLMGDYGIPITKIVQHNHWSGKDCPHRIRKGEPYGWNIFLEKVKGYYAAVAQVKQEAIPSPATNEAKQTPQKVLWAVQAGAFKEKKNAQNYAAELQKKGLQTYTVYQGGFWRIQTGAFAVKANATSYAKALCEKGITCFVVKKGEL